MLALRSYLAVDRVKGIPSSLSAGRLTSTHLLGKYQGIGVILFSRGHMTILQAYRKIDWAKHALTGYVVIDPLNPGLLEYLDEASYRSLQKVCLSKDKQLVVIATPDNTPEDLAKINGSDNSPLKGWNRVKAIGKRYFRPLLWNSKEFPIRDAMVYPTEGNLTSLIFKWGCNLHFWSGQNRRAAKLRHLSQYAKLLSNRLRTEGAKYLILRLKVSLFAVNAYLSGNPIKDTRKLGMAIGITNGLPKDLPLAVRSAIRSKSIRTIRIWASILNAYKALQGPYPELPLDTITASPFKWEYPGLQQFLPDFWKFMLWNTEVKTVLTSSMKTYFSVAAGPNHRISILSAAADAAYWGAHRNAPIWEWLDATGRYELRMIMEYFYNQFKSSAGITDDIIKRDFICGKLVTKEEAAGKLRVFAIVDYWTQTVLQPIHDWLFSILRSIPTDGTFNQEHAIESLVKRGHKSYFCYDLKAATDMIPSTLYETVMGHVMTPRLAKLWMRVLTERDFRLPQKGKSNDSSSKFVRYTRGQPMGALSSWASLAVIHHFVVQLSAKEAGSRIPFVEYRVLGDDIVIADAKVAENYTQVCSKLGIPIGLPKSFTSEQGFLNFANQSILGEDNISPASLKEEIQVRGAPSRLEMAHRFMRRGWTEPKVVKGLRLLFHPSDWMKEMRRSKVDGLTPALLRSLRVLLGPNPRILERLGVKSGALQAWFLALRPGGGLLAPFSRLSDPEFKALDPKLQSRLLYDMADMYYQHIKQKDATNLGSMKVFHTWVSGVIPEWGVSAKPLLSTIMTWRDSSAKSKASILLEEAYKLRQLVRNPLVDIAIREASVVRIMRIEAEFPTLPDFRNSMVLEAEHLKRSGNKDIVTDQALIQLALFLEKADATVRNRA